MAEKDSPFSMFGDAARAKKKPAPPRQTQAPSARPQPEEMPAPLPAPIGPPAGFEEIQSMLDQAKKYRDELTDKLDRIQSVTGWDLKGMDDYLSNPSNFKPGEWEMVKMRKQALESQFFQMMGKATGGVEQAKVEVRKQEISKSAKERKGKSLGARKGWIPMK